ncbi:hypothetical protein BGZ75_001143 [Mortierella antarctica]|nr:hypothetical protein BGZ75_001143 [Mortierella antarctica]
MKFAKYLQDEVVPEWRKAYINYKQGKKYLKAIERALDELEAAGPLDPAAIPIELLEAVEQEQGADPSHHPHVHYYPQQPPLLQQPPSRPQPQSFHQKDPSSESDTAARTTTPIISRKRGHGRNYSAIIIPPLSSGSVVSQPNTNTTSLQGTTLVDDDRSRAGGSFINDNETVQSGSRGPLQTPTKSASTGSTAYQFGQAARTQSSQILKSLSRRFTIVGSSEFPARSRSIQVDDGPIDRILDQLLPEERDFFQFLDGQLDMVNSFYKEKELEAVTKLKVIKQQLFVANEWKRRHDEKMAKAEAERGWYIAEWSRVRKGLDNLMRADSAVTEDVTIGPTRKPYQLPDLRTAFTTSSVTGSLPDPEQGLRQRDPRSVDSLSDLNSGKTGADVMVVQDELVLQDAESRRQHLNHKVARTRIKAALYEFYRSLEMVKNYKVLNHTGFAKILKKFDKTAGWKASKPYLNQRLKPAYFMTSTIVQDLIKETEDVFIDAFEKGHRRRGMAKLRIPDSKNHTHHLTSTRIGLYMGLAAPLLVQALQAAFSDETPAEIPYWDGLLLVYGGLFLTILFACLFGINMYVWAKSRINYKFIFEFDPRDNLDFHEYFELPIFMMLLLTLAVYLDFGSKLTAHVATAYWPLILMAITAVILFCPLPIAHFTARRWFLSSIGRIIASGYYRVEFRDFFLADEMNSLSYSIEQFEFAMCAYSQQWSDLGNTCSTSHMWITPFVTGLPAWFRFLQCLRRYRDTLEWFPHLLNAGKYSASLLNLFVYFSFRHYGGPQLKAAWIAVSLFTSIYTFAWDIYMDWGLFRFGSLKGGAQGHPFLRQELVYSRTWVYYMAIVLDFVGRFSWLARLIPMNVNVYLLSFSLAFIEVLRRWQWNFFRLENEHLNNCGQFRAIKDIPLPFHIRVEGESDEEEEEEDQDEYRSEDEDESHTKKGDLDRAGSDRRVSHAYQSTHSGRRSGMVRSKSSQGSFAEFINGGHAHGLSKLGGPATGDRHASTSRASLHSAISSRNSSYPYLGTHQADESGAARSRTSLGRSVHSHMEQPPVHPFGLARSNSFVEVAVAEAGFKDSVREGIEQDVNRNKFYDRRDFDSKMIDTDSHVWAARPSAPRARSGTGSGSLHGLQNLALGAAGGLDGSGGRVAEMDRRSRSQGVPQRRKMSIGTRMRQSIFGTPKRGDSDDDEEDEEDGLDYPQ